MSTTTRRTTVADLEREGAPEGRWELIDGALVEISPAGGIASRTGASIGTLLMNHVAPRGLGAVLSADAGFVLFPDRQTVRVTTVSVVRADRLPTVDQRDRFIRGGPDLAVQVLSPHDQVAEIDAKMQMFLDAGTTLVWVVDPPARTVAVHAPERVVRLLSDGDALDGGNAVPGFQTTVDALFR